MAVAAIVAMPSLRSADASDYDAVAGLYRQFAPNRHLDLFTYDGWAGRCRVAVQDEEVLGFWHGTHDSQTWLSFTVQPQPEEEWTVSYLTVLVVDARHRRSGIGTMLLEDFVAHAGAAGNTWAVLNPSSDAEGQTEAQLIAFYQRHGFVLLEHGLDHGFASSWMMGRALVEDPRYQFREISSTGASSR